jgi:uncharacterized membrane protein
MRGLACVLMFQTHCYDSWLNPAARKSSFFMWSQILGTFPAPLFLFLAGFSFCLVTDKLRQRGVAAGQIARTTIRRGAEILGLGLLFRFQEYVVAFPWAPWSDLLRVDILNTIGVSMMLMGIVCWLTARATASWKEADGGEGKRLTYAATAACTATGIAMVTPMIWTRWRPHWLPWPLESYLDGVHNLGVPQSWLFPIFPWAGFGFAGLAVGFLLVSSWARKREGLAVLIAGASGLLLLGLAKWLDARPQIYPVYDFWRTSPNFFLMRVGMLMMILLAAYAWCRWGAGGRGFSPLMQLGQTSLLVYWVHIEFVYGRVSILKKHGMTVGGATLGLLIIFLFMLGLSMVRTRMKKLKTGTSWKQAAQAS